MVKTLVALPRPVLAQLRRLAKREHTVVTHYVRVAVEEWLKRRAKR